MTAYTVVLPVAKATPGSRLAKAVVDASGNTLLPEGIMLDQRLLRFLGLWDINEIAVARSRKKQENVAAHNFLAGGNYELAKDIKLAINMLTEEKCFFLEDYMGHLFIKAVEQLSHNKQMRKYLLELKVVDSYTYRHSLCTGLISVGQAVLLGWKDSGIVELGIAAMLHDIGKMKIPQSILKKQGPLTPSEWELMRKHPEHGLDMLCGCDDINARILDAILQHHERLNATGYPKQLEQHEISEFAKIIALADSYDAMTSNRCYKQALPAHVAMKEILEDELSYDQRYVKVLEDMFVFFPIGCEVMLNNGATGVVTRYRKNRPAKPQLLLTQDVLGVSLKQPVWCDLEHYSDVIVVRRISR